MRIVECTGWLATCEARGVRRAVNLALVDAQPVGTWVLVTQSLAREVLTAESAWRIDRALDGLEAALQGQRDLSIYFEDLLARPPRADE
jgi:hydrogenase assembly chaperone HypC/HupF